MRAAAALLVLLPLLAACDSDPDQDAGPVITIAEREWNSYPMAVIAGTLVEEKNCLLLDDHLVFWPHGTSWDTDAHAVIQTDGSRAVVGDPYRGGGGEYDTDVDVADLLGSQDAADRIADCLASTGAHGLVVATPY